MRKVVFVAPFFLETTLRFVRAAALPGVRLGLVSQQPLEQLPAAVRRRLAAHWRVDNALDAEQLVGAVRGLGRQLGGVDRLLGVLEHLQVPLAEVREALSLPGVGVAVAENFRDKNRMKTVLAEAGLPCARHRLVESAEAARDFARRTGFPLVAKPPAGAGATGTFRADDDAALEQVLGLCRPSPARPLLLEQFLVGREYSFDSVVIAGQPVWHSISRYLPTPLEALRNPWIQWCVLLPREIEGPEFADIREVAFGALQALGLETGLSHMEWFRLGDGRVAVSEVGARPPGAQITPLTSYAHDFDLYRAWARLMIFDEFEPPVRRFAAGAAFLRGQGRGRVHRIVGLEQLQQELGPLVVESHLPRPGQAPSTSYEGEGFVIVRHRRTEVVERALHRIVSTLRVELK
ncbi:MAG: hypothetical protein AAF604_10405 [Acidobacteriota bacterium]